MIILKFLPDHRLCLFCTFINLAVSRVMMASESPASPSSIIAPINRLCRLRDRLYKYYKQEPDSIVLSPPPQKDNATADKMRLEGHSHFLASHFVNAIDSYNKSLCHSEITGDRFNLSMTYGHRAEALFKMGLFNECLSSIELALASNYPEKFTNRMQILQRKCKEQIDREATTPSYNNQGTSVKLSHPANERLPCIEGLRLAENDQYGRHIITERDLAVGDVIGVEEAYLAGLNRSDLYRRCSHCMSEQRHALFPCSFCTIAMFCSQGCEKAAWHEYHRYECPLLDCLLPLEPAARLSVRALFVGLSIFKDFVALQRFLTKSRRSKRKVSVFDLDYRHLDEKDRFLSYWQLFRGDRHFGRHLNTRNMKRSAEILRLLKQRQNELTEQIDSKETEEFLLKFLYHGICIHLNNAYELGTFLPHTDGSYPIGVGLFLTFSMASHSCAPNVMRIQRGRVQHWIVLRPIRRGDQIFDNYGMTFQKEPREQRQFRSYSHYGFQCQCEACENDYPLKEELPRVKEIPWDQVVSECGIDFGNSQAVDEKLTQVAQFLQKYDGYYPCQQLIEADGIFWNLFRLSLQVVSLEYRFIQFYKAEE